MSVGDARQIVLAWKAHIAAHPSEAHAPHHVNYDFIIRRTLNLPIKDLNQTLGAHPHSMREGMFALKERFPNFSQDELKQVAVAWHGSVINQN